jgi:hypothetical protein
MLNECLIRSPSRASDKAAVLRRGVQLRIRRQRVLVARSYRKGFEAIRERIGRSCKPRGGVQNS